MYRYQLNFHKNVKVKKQNYINFKINEYDYNITCIFVFLLLLLFLVISDFTL